MFYIYTNSLICYLKTQDASICLLVYCSLKTLKLVLLHISDTVNWRVDSKSIGYVLFRFREQRDFDRGNKGTWRIILGNRGAPEECFWGTFAFFVREQGNIVKKTWGTGEHIPPL